MMDYIRKYVTSTFEKNLHFTDTALIYVDLQIMQSKERQFLFLHNVISSFPRKEIYWIFFYLLYRLSADRLRKEHANGIPRMLHLC